MSNCRNLKNYTLDLTHPLRGTAGRVPVYEFPKIFREALLVTDSEAYPQNMLMLHASFKHQQKLLFLYSFVHFVLTSNLKYPIQLL